ncbi:MAG: hypothetical protein AAEJ57_07480, partial [Opitutales bacterium]
SYFIQATKISGNRKWFGSFRFATGDRYPDGAWWHALKPPKREADLVFRTYVGKTNAQVTAERALRHEEVKERQRLKKQNDNQPPRPIIPRGESVPLPPPDPLPPAKPPVDQNSSRKPLLPFLRPQG